MAYINTIVALIMSASIINPIMVLHPPPICRVCSNALLTPQVLRKNIANTIIVALIANVIVNIARSLSIFVPVLSISPS